MLFSRHTSDDPELSGTSCCNNNNRCSCDCQGPQGPRGCPVLPDPEAVPVPLVQWDLRAPRVNPDFKATQVLSDLLEPLALPDLSELPEPLALPDLPELSDLLALPGLSDLLVLPGLPDLLEPLVLPDLPVL